MQHPVRIDKACCLKTAELIKGTGLRKTFYQRPFLKIQVHLETRLRGYFYAVAICHQTYSLYNPELKLFGWDYLEYVFTSLMQEEDELLRPGMLVNMDPNYLQSKLAGLFSVEHSPEKSTLDRIVERTRMLIELDRFIEVKYNSSLSKLTSHLKGLLLNYGSGYYEILPAIPAFADPMKKKITFLVKLMEEAEMVTIFDPWNFIPIMDYHMQRVLLRMGCVEIVDEELRNKLILRELLPNDIEIRQACIKAFRIISADSGHKVTKLNDFFWSLGRSCCNQEPRCRFNRCEKEPCTFFEIVAIKKHNNCFFEPVCKGFSSESYRKLWQPVVETHYY